MIYLDMYTCIIYIAYTVGGGMFQPAGYPSESPLVLVGMGVPQ